MPSSTRSTRTRSKTSSQTAESSKKARPTRKSQQKLRPQSEDEEETATSSYFQKEYDSDALDEDSARGAKKTQSPRKKRKVDDEDYDQADEAGPTGKKTYDSDALDEDSDDGTVKRKRKGRSSTSTSPKKSQSPRKKKKQVDESEEEFEADLKEGQEVVGVVVQAPKTGRVPPGQISQNTLNFLNKLKDPACNDRQWCVFHVFHWTFHADLGIEPVYRLAEKEWKHFIEAFTDVLTEVDPQIPHLPPKDVTHRIYRDIRFSNDKTPYKQGFSASFSRSGRKGIFAGANIQRNSRRLRNVISAPSLSNSLANRTPPKGEPQNIFGFEDELKVAPKGVMKDDKDIDLLKCRSFAIASVARIMQPFVHCLNDMMTVMGDDEEDDESEEGE
ncbi:hypothetical protein BDZ97DRAFT_1811025 [Flammula alnicola]|nr:hypothetical protein BDZ97DRAFT_1811025 [Flammula alnicola]